MPFQMIKTSGHTDCFQKSLNGLIMANYYSHQPQKWKKEGKRNGRRKKKERRRIQSGSIDAWLAWSEAVPSRLTHHVSAEATWQPLSVKRLQLMLWDMTERKEIERMKRLSRKERKREGRKLKGGKKGRKWLVGNLSYETRSTKY